MIRRALFLSLFQRHVALGISFVSSVILARLLSPEEVGVYSIAAAVVAMATLLRDFGVGEYVIQERNLTREKQRAAFTVTLGMAWLIALVLFVIAHPLASYYREPGIIAVLNVLACNFLLLPFGSVTFAVLTKNMEFGTILFVQTASALVHASVSISLAYQGFSYMSLAWASLVGSVVTIATLGALRPQETLLMPTLSGLRCVARFGGFLTFAHLVSQALRRAPEFLIAGQVGFQALGLYSRGTGLVDTFNDLFTAAISRVAGPMFASKDRKPGNLGQSYIGAASMYSAVAVPFFVFLAVFAQPVTHALFGPAWLDSVSVAQVFAIGSAVASPYVLVGPFLTGTGRPDAVVRITLSRVPIVVLGLLVGANFGLNGILVGLLVAGVISLTVFQSALRRSADVTWGQVQGVYRASFAFAGTTTAASAPALLLYSNSTLSAVLSLLVGGCLALVSWCILLPRFNSPLAAELSSAIKRVRGHLPGGSIN